MSSLNTKEALVWHGSVSVASNYKKDSYYFSSSKPALRDAIDEALEKYAYQEVLEFNISLI